MKENKRNIDEFFREELGNHTEMPPSSVWENLENRIDQQNGSKRKVVGWWFYSLIAVLLLCGSIAAYISYTKNQKTNNQTAIFADSQNNKFQGNDELAATQNNNYTLLHENEKELNNALQNKDLGSDLDNANGINKSENDAEFGNNKNKKSIGNNLNAGNISNKNDRNKNGNLSGKKDNSRNKEKGIIPSSKENNKSDGKDFVGKNGKSGIKSTNQNTNNKSSSAPKNDAPKNSTEQNTENNNSGSSNKNDVSNNRNNKNKSLSLNRNDVKNNASNSGKKGNLNAANNQDRIPIADQNKPFVKNDLEISAAKNNIKKPLDIDAALDNSKNNYSPKAAIDKPKNNVALKPKNEIKPEVRGLSGAPDINEDDPEEDPVKLSDIYKLEPAAKKESPVVQKENQVEKIQKALAANPLAGAPVEANIIGEPDKDSDGNPVTPQSPGSGGGGGAAGAAKEKIKRSLGMTIGVKAGYETGAAKYTSSKFVGNIFAEINLNKRLTFLMQPGIRMAQTNLKFNSNSQSFIDPGNTSISLFNTEDTAGKTIRWDYAYRQNYDSLIATITKEVRFVEIEIPFLFKYKIDEHFSIMAGLNFSFGKTLGSKISISRKTNTITDTTYQMFDSIARGPSGKFSHAGAKLFSSFEEPAGVNAPSPMRFGYNIGFSYSFKQRLMLDLMIQQNLSGLSNIKDADVRKIFAQPYVRLSLGVILFGKKQ